MKLCNAEIMKRIKLLEQEKSEIEEEEQRLCTTTYQSDLDKLSSDYDFKDTRSKIGNINGDIRDLKHLLNLSNSTVSSGYYHMTIGECLIYMAQLNKEKEILENLVRKEQVSRHSTYNGVIEYTKLNYDKAECKERLKKTQEDIAEIQIAIDRTNLTNMIEID